MKTIEIYKADGAVKNETIEDITIVIRENVTMSVQSKGSLEYVGKFYDEQAEKFVDALFSALPQGTADRLWIKAMQRKISLYIGRTNS